MGRHGHPGILIAMVTVSYHTDPGCPWSWGAEPAVRKLMTEFGDGLAWRWVMAGLARDLAPGESPAASLPPEIRAERMEEWLCVSEKTGAPLDPLLWRDGPLRTTYPACMAVKAAQEQAADGGYAYLRRLREAIMCERRKLDGAEALTEEARAAGLDVERFRLSLRSHAITEAFGADLEATEALAGEARDPDEVSSVGREGVPLPTAVFAGGEERRVVSGAASYDAYREAAVTCGAEPAGDSRIGVERALARFGRVTTREVELVCELPGPRAGAELWGLAEAWKVRAVPVLTGHLWEAA
jgi:protein-disulfide isomerase-like protein with CxxC motif